MNAAYSLIVDDGGPVAVALFVLSFVMWWVVYQRFGLLKYDSVRSEQRFRNRAILLLRRRREPIHTIDARYTAARKQLSGWRTFLRSLVAAAPLLGLLGTVEGMIETFSTLHLSGLAHADESVAGGISMALLTTQLGLLIGIPGHLASRALDRMEEKRALVLDDVRQNLVVESLERSEDTVSNRHTTDGKSGGRV